MTPTNEIGIKLDDGTVVYFYAGSASTNIYENDGILTGDRALDGDTNNLDFINIGEFFVKGDASLGLESDNIITLTAPIIDIKDGHIQLSDLAGDIQGIRNVAGDIEIYSDAYQVWVSANSGLRVTNGIISDNSTGLMGWQNNGFVGTLLGTTLTDSRSWTLQDDDGTLAFLSDISTDNLYNIDGQLTGTREVDMNEFDLFFTESTPLIPAMGFPFNTPEIPAYKKIVLGAISELGYPQLKSETSITFTDEIINEGIAETTRTTIGAGYANFGLGLPNASVGADGFTVRESNGSGLEITSLAPNALTYLDQSGGPFPVLSTTISFEAPTAIRTVMVQDGDGTLAFLSDIVGGTHEGYDETGTRVGGNLIVTIGDYDDSGVGTKIIINDGDETVKSSVSFFAPNYNMEDSGFTLGIYPPTLTSDRSQTYQDKDGIIALLSDITVGGNHEGYTDSGTRAGGDLIVTIGDYDDSNEGTRVILDDDDGSVSFYFENALKHTISIDEAIFEGAVSINSSFKAILTSTLLTANRNFSLPDKDGVIATLSDIPRTTTPILSLGAPDADIAVNTYVDYFDAPFDGTLDDIEATLKTAPTVSVATFNINKNGVTMLSTAVTIDATEVTSTTAAIPPVISVASFLKGDRITVAVDGIGDGDAGTGGKMTLYLTETL